MIFPSWQIWISGQCVPDAIGRSQTDSFSELLTLSGMKSVCGAQRAGMRSRTRAFCVSANFSASGTTLSEYCPTLLLFWFYHCHSVSAKMPYTHNIEVFRNCFYCFIAFIVQ